VLQAGARTSLSRLRPGKSGKRCSGYGLFRSDRQPSAVCEGFQSMERYFFDALDGDRIIEDPMGIAAAPTCVCAIRAEFVMASIAPGQG
jgi:hypothetical protein